MVTLDLTIGVKAKVISLIPSRTYVKGEIVAGCISCLTMKAQVDQVTIESLIPSGIIVECQILQMTSIVPGGPSHN